MARPGPNRHQWICIPTPVWMREELEREGVAPRTPAAALSTCPRASTRDHTGTTRDGISRPRRQGRTAWLSQTRMAPKTSAFLPQRTSSRTTSPSVASAAMRTTTSLCVATASVVGASATISERASGANSNPPRACNQVKRRADGPGADGPGSLAPNRRRAAASSPAPVQRSDCVSFHGSTSPVGAQGVCGPRPLQQERPASRFSHVRSLASHAYVRPGPRNSRRAPVCEDLARVDCSESPLTSPGFGSRRVSLRSDHSWRNR